MQVTLVRVIIAVYLLSWFLNMFLMRDPVCSLARNFELLQVASLQHLSELE